jgi:hypothetical protein
MHPIYHPPPAPFAPPPWPHLLYDPAAIAGQVLAAADKALTALILFGLWVGLAAGLGLALAALLHRYGPGMASRDAILTAAVLLTAGYAINSIPFWRGFPSVVALVTAMLVAAKRLSPASPASASRVQAFWARHLVACSPGRREASS